MTTSGGDWVAVPVPGQPERWDYVPAEQPASPDGSPGSWHVVGGSGAEVGTWEWFPAAPPAPPPPPPAPMPWETAAPGPAAAEPIPPVPAAWEPTPPAPAWGEQVTEPVAREPWEPAVQQPVAGAPTAQQPMFGGPPAPVAGWHAAPPVAVGRPKRSLTLPLAILGAVVVIAAIGVGALVLLAGGDDGKNKEEITALVNYVATVDDGKDVCTSHLTDGFVRTVFGTVEACERDDDDSADESGDATGATVTEIEIDGDTATALVTVVGGDTDGATGTWGFLKNAEDVWKVSEWRADYLRSSFERSFGENYDSDGPNDPFDDEDVRGCVRDQMLGQSDDDFLDLAYDLFRKSDDSVRKMLGFMSECPSDIEGVSALRELFEEGFRASAQLPPTVTECIVVGMRNGLSEEDIRQLTLRSDAPLPADIQSRIEQITMGCAGGPATFDPTPDGFGATPPTFGT